MRDFSEALPLLSHSQDHPSRSAGEGGATGTPSASAVIATYEAEEERGRNRDGFLHCKIVEAAIERAAEVHAMPSPEVREILRDHWTPEVGG